MDRFELETLLRAQNDVVKKPLMMISVFEEVLVTQFELDNVRIGHESFLNKGVVTIVNFLKAFFQRSCQFFGREKPCRRLGRDRDDIGIITHRFNGCST